MTMHYWIQEGFIPDTDSITGNKTLKYDCERYHITLSIETYGQDERHTCHIDGNDYSTIGFGYIQNIEDLKLLLNSIGMFTTKLKNYD